MHPQSTFVVHPSVIQPSVPSLLLVTADNLVLITFIGLNLNDLWDPCSFRVCINCRLVSFRMVTRVQDFYWLPPPSTVTCRIKVKGGRRKGSLNFNFINRSSTKRDCQPVDGLKNGSIERILRRATELQINSLQFKWGSNVRTEKDKETPPVTRCHRDTDWDICCWESLDRENGEFHS